MPGYPLAHVVGGEDIASHEMLVVGLGGSAISLIGAIFATRQPGQIIQRVFHTANPTVGIKVIEGKVGPSVG